MATKQCVYLVASEGHIISPSGIKLAKVVATPLTRHESEPVRCGRLLPECLHQKQQLFWKEWSVSTWLTVTLCTVYVYCVY